MKTHVIFGTGSLGKSTARALVALGQGVRVVNRSGKAEGLPAAVEVVKGDAYDPAHVHALTRGAEAVYGCAQPAYHRWAQDFPPLQASMLEGVARSGAKFIVAENLYMYGDPHGQPLTETTPINPMSRKGRVRAEMAASLMAAHRAGRVRVAVGRASHFFGSEYALLNTMLVAPALRGGRTFFMGKLEVPHTFTYVPDFGRALAVLGTHEAALGEVWHVPSPAPLTQRAFASMVYEEAGHKECLKVTSINRPLLRLLGLFSRDAYESLEMMYEFEQPYIMDSSKFEAAFSLRATPIREAICETVAHFRDHPTPLRAHA